MYYEMKCILPLQMSVTLAQIWAASADELEPILHSAQRELTGNLNYDRATVALIYYNANMLVERNIVAKPDFVAVMERTSTLNEGIDILTASERKQFYTTLLALCLSMRDADKTTLNLLNLRAGIPAFTDIDRRSPAEPREIAAGYGVAIALEVITGFVDKPPQLLSVPERLNSLKYVRNDVSMADVARLNAAVPVKPTNFEPLAAWRLVLEAQSKIMATAALLNIREPSPPNFVIHRLLGFDLSHIIPVAKCYFLYMLWELMALNDTIMTSSHTLSVLDAAARFNTLVTRYGCTDIFAEVPSEVTTGYCRGPN